MEKMTSYDRVRIVLEGRKPDVCPVIPMVREWCSKQAGIEFIDELESVEKPGAVCAMHTAWVHWKHGRCDRLAYGGA